MAGRAMLDKYDYRRDEVPDGFEQIAYDQQNDETRHCSVDAVLLRQARPGFHRTYWCRKSKVSTFIKE